MTRILESSDAPSAGADTKQQLMKAIAVFPGRPDSVHLAQLPKPRVSDIPGGRGVLVKVLRVGVDGTDKEINAAEYGAAPEGYDFLVTGHESFGRVAIAPRTVHMRHLALVTQHRHDGRVDVLSDQERVGNLEHRAGVDDHVVELHAQGGDRGAQVRGR